MSNKISKLFLVVFIVLVILNISSCINSDELNKAHLYTKYANDYYRSAISEYKKLIKEGKDLDRLYFELGRLYYQHGDFDLAKDELLNSQEKEAKKYLALSYYHLGKFTDALDIFSRNDLRDEEYQYYYGLTCEKLNLFDKATDIYSKLKSPRFSKLATQRVSLIDKEEGVFIQEVSPQTAKILREAPAKENYPQAGALILLCDEKLITTRENTQIYETHCIIKILNERGKEDFSETAIDYDSTDEKVELEFARTIKPDGRIREVGSRHIRDVSKYLNFPLYSNARVYIISFPEITEESVIEYKLKIYRNQLVNKKDFALAYPLQAQEPVIKATFSLELPEERNLNIKLLNQQYNNFSANLTPKIGKRDGKVFYNWDFGDIPQIIPENNMPPLAEINPAIFISTFNSWQEIFNWWWGLAQDKIRADKKIKEKVAELTKNKESAEDKARAIYNFCAQKIRYVAVEYGDAGYEPHKAEDIFSNKYGDCKDQAILLVTMLREAGIKAYPVLIATKEYYNLIEDFPSMLFNHCIAVAILSDKLIFMDPTAETCHFKDLPISDQDRRVLLFKDSAYEIQNTPLYSGGHNLSKQYLKLRLESDESLTGEKDVYTAGIYEQAQRAWLIYTPPELIEEAIKQKIQDISIGATLDSYKIENANNLDKPVILKYTFKGPEYLTLAGNLRIMPQLVSVDTSLVAKDKRKYPLDFNFLDSKELTYEIIIPNNFKLKYLPENIDIDNKWEKLKIEYIQDKNKIIFRQKAETKQINIAQEEYAQFKDFYESLAKKVKQRIVLEKIK
jgi:hypothetical protein